MNAARKHLLLVQPPFHRLYDDGYSVGRNPLSLAYLAGAVLRDTDWSVRILNADYSFSPQRHKIDIRFLTGEGYRNYREHLDAPGYGVWQEVRRTVEAERPGVVGISATTQTFASALRVARIIKEVDEGIRVVVGGPHVSMVRAGALDAEQLDLAVYGEGEYTLVDLLRGLEAERPLADIPGLIHRDNGRIVVNQERPHILDLDNLPFPIDVFERTLIDFPRFPPGAFADIFAVRGCPNACTFCGSRYIWSRRVRWRSVANVVAELRRLQRTGIRCVYFADDIFGVNRRRLLELCRAIQYQCPGLEWWCELHVKLVTQDVVLAMKEAGCTRVQIGVESGSNEILRAIRKNITIDEARDAARILQQAGIAVDAFFMVGFPQETEQTLLETMAAIRTFPSDHICYSIFMPYPGTEIFAECREQGIIPADFDVSRHNHQSPENHFCPAIPVTVFRACLDELEADIDRRNASTEGNMQERNLALLEAMVESDPSNPFVWICLGTSRVPLDPPGAAAAFERALTLIETTGRHDAGETYVLGIHLHLVRLAIARNAGAEVGPLLKRALAAFPDSPDLHYAAGMYHAGRKEDVEAAGHFRACLADRARAFPYVEDSGSRGWAARTQLGLCLLRANRLGEAEGELRAAADIAPPWAALPHHILGILLLSRGRPLDAEAALREGSGREPQNKEIHRAWARALIKLGRTEEAERVLANSAPGSAK